MLWNAEEARLFGTVILATTINLVAGIVTG
jgi:hypothetical protein